MSNKGTELSLFSDILADRGSVPACLGVDDRSGDLVESNMVDDAESRHCKYMSTLL